MVAIDNTHDFAAPMDARARRGAHIVLGALGMAALIAVASFLLEGGGINGSRAGAEMVMRFSAFAFVVAWIAGPFARLFPGKATKALSDEQRPLTLAFLAVHSVFLACVVLPNFMSGEAMPMPTLMFCFFTGFMLVAMLMSLPKISERFLGPAKRAIESLCWGFFWLTFAAAALDRTVGPHRPDFYHGPCLTLLVVALLLRFADAFFQRHKFRQAEKAG